MMARLNKEEKEILDAFERRKMKPIPEKSVALKQHQKSAEATFRKGKRINIRISSRHPNLIKRRALTKGIPYQML